ncbi:uncharacterized protein LOC141538133 [Cotesia typhae]|uniref:uncharacterized protein LOC141538133 n=1 Tax=Cotesia typhae TaxID=2053667 RepID=UPI003D690981
MRFIKIILCCCCVFTGHFSNGSHIDASEIKTRLINHTMELINKCFTDNLNPVIISSDLVVDQVVSANVVNENPLIIVDGNFKRKPIEGHHPGYPTYVVLFKSMPKLVSLIFDFMDSTIWSIKSPIFILDISEKFYVTRPDSVLGFLASFDILVSYYLRYEKDQNSTILYTLNPYTQFAPLPWNQVKTSNGNNTTKPTLYSMEYPKAMPEFHGQISAILAQPARRNVETLKDLFDNKYHVFYDPILINDMMNEKLWVNGEDQKYLHPSSDLNLKKCITAAQQTSTIACVTLTKWLLMEALKLKNLYVSKESVFKLYYVFWTKKN